MCVIKKKAKKFPETLKDANAWPFTYISTDRGHYYMFGYSNTQRERNVSNVVTKKHDLGKFQEGKFQISRNTPR